MDNEQRKADKLESALRAELAYIHQLLVTQNEAAGADLLKEMIGYVHNEIESETLGVQERNPGFRNW